MSEKQLETFYTAASVKVLDGVASVRRRPGMYFGSVGPSGAKNVIEEFIANTADLFLEGSATRCRVSRNETPAGIEWVVEDDGPGLPFDIEDQGAPLAVHYLTSLHFTPTRDDHAPHVHVGGLHGVGLGAVAAVCSRLEVASWRAGQRWHLLLGEGEVLEGPAVIEHGHGRGTVFRAVLDPTIFGSSQPDLSALRAGLIEAAHLMAGWQVSFSDEVFHAPEGLKSLLALHAPPRSEFGETRAEHHAWEDERIRVEVAASGLSEEAHTVWRSWVNCGGTLGGSHVDGARKAFEAVGWKPGAAMIHVVFREPAYAGPTKECIDVPWVETAVYEGLLSRLEKVE
jgi:DNA gyrase subunit B